MELRKTDPAFLERFNHFVTEEVAVEEGQTLDAPTRYLAILATLIGCGGVDAYREILPQALENGLTPIAVKECVYQATDYLGYGRMLPFLYATNEIMTEREIALPLVDQTTTTFDDRLEKGIAAQVAIFGEHMNEAWKKGHIQRWLADNCFGDYYTRTGLSLRERELITFCFLMAQGGCEPQLIAHAKGNMHIGNDRAFLIRVVSQCLPYIGYPRSLNALSCIDKAAVDSAVEKRPAFDARMVGKWYKAEMGETIHIFPEDPPRMKMSFSTSGHYNFEPNCVYTDGDALCWEINDEYYRMVYRVRYEDGKLRGVYTQFGRETPVVYERVSDTPEDGEYLYISPNEYVPGRKTTRREILTEYAEYAPCAAVVPETTYALGGPAPEILSQYDYASYLDGKKGDDLVFAALAFVCDHFYHNGSIGLGNDRTITGLIRFCETHDGRMNCRGLAILLAAILRLQGIRARHITCKPYEEPFDDCHVVVDCELPSGERVMLDPSNRLYYTDTAGRYVSIERLREMCVSGEALIPNADASYNGGPFDAAENHKYMTKNTFRFNRGTKFADGVDDRGVDLIPAKYAEKQNTQCAYTTDPAAFWRM